MKSELKKIADVLRDKLNAIKMQGYTDERLEAAMDVFEELNHKLGGDAPGSAIEIDNEELVDDGTADGD